MSYEAIKQELDSNHAPLKGDVTVLDTLLNKIPTFRWVFRVADWGQMGVLQRRVKYWNLLFKVAVCGVSRSMNWERTGVWSHGKTLFWCFSSQLCFCKKEPRKTFINSAKVHFMVVLHHQICREKYRKEENHNITSKWLVEILLLQVL